MVRRKRELLLGRAGRGGEKSERWMVGICGNFWYSVTSTYHWGLEKI